MGIRGLSAILMTVLAVAWHGPASAEGRAAWEGDVEAGESLKISTPAT